MKKTFKIGEQVVGGIIEVIADNSTLTINFKDYFSKETILSKSFDYKNNPDIENDILFYITENGTSYYGDKILKYIKSKIDLNKANTYYW
jgi:hypothetical protein